MNVQEANRRHTNHYLTMAQNICAIHAGPDLDNIDKAFKHARQAVDAYSALLEACKIQLEALQKLIINEDIDMIVTPEPVIRDAITAGVSAIVAAQAEGESR